MEPDEGGVIEGKKMGFRSISAALPIDVELGGKGGGGGVIAE